MSINGLLFDIENVFFDSTTWLRWTVQQLRGLGVDATYDSFCSGFCRTDLEHVFCGAIDHWEIARKRLARAGLTASQNDEIVMVGRRQFPHPYYRARLFPGVAESLSLLAASGYRLGILGNCHLRASELEPHLKSIGIVCRFSSIITVATIRAT